VGENNLKSNRNDAISAHMPVALRRVMRVIELHSRRLQQSHGLTGPQAVIRAFGVYVGRIWVASIFAAV